MVKSFQDGLTESIWRRQRIKGFPSDLYKVTRRKLGFLEDAVELKGKRSGQHSIRINDQWRVCFRWEDGNALDVEITDYH